MGIFTTYTGRQVDLANPDPSSICIEDIGHSLAGQCRFYGHTRVHYSVAQHSVLVARLCPPELRLQGLLHDAPEAYIGDWSSPLKRTLSPAALAELRAIEARIADAISESLGVRLRHMSLVKHFDRMLLRVESENLIGGDVEELAELPAATFRDFTPWSARTAELRFLAMFERLTVRARRSRLAVVA